VSRIAATFETLKARRRKALIPYVTAGDPFPDASAELMLAMAEAGADVIELGVPFSDPMADGPVIARAAERALARGIALSHVLAMVSTFRAKNDRTPVVLMGYANPIERYGVERFVADARRAGVDGVIVVDYPPEESEGFTAQLKAAGIDLIFLLAPTSTDARIEQVGRVASGFVYYVSLKGVTGAGHLDVAAVAQMLPRIRARINLPIGVGFGIRDAASAVAVARLADAVVIGARIVQLLETQTRETLVPAARAFVAEIRAALDSARGDEA